MHAKTSNLEKPMNPQPKNHVALYGAASLLAAAGLSAIYLNSDAPAPA
ncbi:MAG: hypothetical protein RLZZ398_1788 [Verrucomicrobiota bacterium]